MKRLTASIFVLSTLGAHAALNFTLPGTSERETWDNLNSSTYNSLNGFTGSYGNPTAAWPAPIAGLHRKRRLRQNLGRRILLQQLDLQRRRRRFVLRLQQQRPAFHRHPRLPNRHRKRLSPRRNPDPDHQRIHPDRPLVQLPQRRRLLHFRLRLRNQLPDHDQLLAVGPHRRNRILVGNHLRHHPARDDLRAERR